MADDLLLRRYLTQQDGLITRDQALAAGVTRKALQHLLRPGGPWQRVLRGVYATFNGRLQEGQRLIAATLYGGPTAMVTGAEACRRAGMRYVPDEDVVRLVVAAEVARSDDGFVRVSASKRLPKPIRRIIPSGNGPDWSQPVVLFVATHRAVLDVAREIGLRISGEIPRFSSGRPILTAPVAAGTYTYALGQVRALICESVQRGLASVDELFAELEEGPRKGSGLARRAMEGVVAGCRSAPECELRDLLATSEFLPMPAFNQPLPGHPRLRPDACWPDVKLIVEIDSAEWHRYGDAPEATEQRRALLASLGWRVLPVSPRRLRSEPAVVLLEIEAAYAAVGAV